MSTVSSVGEKYEVKPLTRQRRAASLTAQALWNLQMEDDVTGKMAAQEIYFSDDEVFNEIEKSIPLRQSAKNIGESSPNTNTDRFKDNKPQKKRGRKRKSESGSHEKNDKLSEHHNCAHEPNEICPKSRTFTRKGKLTAAVAPLVKCDPTWKASNVPRPSIGNPFVNTLNPPSHLFSGKSSFFGMSENILPSSSGNPMFRFNHNNWVKKYSAPQRGSYICNTNALTRVIPQSSTVTKVQHDNYSHQDQPLNLKLGESLIPSIRNKEVTLPSQNNDDKTKYKAGNSNMAISKPIVKAIPIQPIVVIPRANKLNFESVTNTDADRSPPYDASSPLSTSGSCYSTESEEPRPGTPSVIKRRRKSSQKVQLRGIAAPAPGQSGNSNLTCRKRRPYFPVKPRKTSKKSSSGIDNTTKGGKKSTGTQKRIFNSQVNNNGWEWDGEPYKALVFSMESLKPEKRLCYPAMKRRSDRAGMEDDVVMVRDCVFLLADGTEQSYVAKVASLWQHPTSGGMMMSVLWYYRPEHTEDWRVLDQVDKYSEDELFASRHLDEISVACVEDKCYVLTYNKYCRYTAAQNKESFLNSDPRSEMLPGTKFGSRPHQRVPDVTDPNSVFFCRKLYDIKLRRVLKTLPPPAPLFDR